MNKEQARIVQIGLVEDERFVSGRRLTLDVPYVRYLSQVDRR